MGTRILVEGREYSTITRKGVAAGVHILRHGRMVGGITPAIEGKSYHMIVMGEPIGFAKSMDAAVLKVCRTVWEWYGNKNKKGRKVE